MTLGGLESVGPGWKSRTLVAALLWNSSSSSSSELSVKAQLQSRHAYPDVEIRCSSDRLWDLAVASIVRCCGHASAGKHSRTVEGCRCHGRIQLSNLVWLPFKSQERYMQHDVVTKWYHPNISMIYSNLEPLPNRLCACRKTHIVCFKSRVVQTSAHLQQPPEVSWRECQCRGNKCLIYGIVCNN